MNSLLLFLFLGASVTFAELPFDDPALVEILNEEGEEILGELQLADEENDPDYYRPTRHPTHHRPTRPPPVVSLFSRNNQQINIYINRDIWKGCASKFPCLGFVSLLRA